MASMVRSAGSPTATSTTHSSRDRGQASPTKRRRHSSHLTPTTWPCCHNGRCAGESPFQGIGQATTIAGASSPTTKGDLATTTPGGRRTAVRHRGDKDRAHPGTTVAEENQIPQETRFQNPQPCWAPGGVATGSCRHPGCPSSKQGTGVRFIPPKGSSTSRPGAPARSTPGRLGYSARLCL